MKFARIENGAVVEYPLTIQDLQKQMPQVAWPSRPSKTALADKPYVVVEEVAKPELAWGEIVVEDTPAFTGGAWKQKWNKSRINLPQAKNALTQMAIEIYWNKMQEPPSVKEMTDHSGSYSAIITAREARLLPKLQDVRTRIQAASTVDVAHTIYKELT